MIEFFRALKYHGEICFSPVLQLPRYILYKHCICLDQNRIAKRQHAIQTAYIAWKLYTERANGNAIIISVIQFKGHCFIEVDPSHLFLLYLSILLKGIFNLWKNTTLVSILFGFSAWYGTESLWSRSRGRHNSRTVLYNMFYSIEKLIRNHYLGPKKAASIYLRFGKGYKVEKVMMCH